VVPITRELLFSPNELKTFFEKENPDVIFHLAAYGNHSNQTDRAMTVFANTLGAFNILDASRDISYKAFVNFSTSSVLLPYETFYSASKAGVERLVKAFVNEYDKPIVNVRPYSIYGEGEAEFRFIPTMVKSMITKEKMKISMGNHDWLYVDDLINALFFVLENAYSLKGKSVNVGTGKSYSNYAIAEIMERVTRKNVPCNYQTDLLRDYDTDKWVADNSLIKSLGWSPKITLEEGLKRCYEYYKKHFTN
jgi:nucleoside-diphosphate-sugar epimerase